MFWTLCKDDENILYVKLNTSQSPVWLYSASKGHLQSARIDRSTYGLVGLVKPFALDILPQNTSANLPSTDFRGQRSTFCWTMKACFERTPTIFYSVILVDWAKNNFGACQPRPFCLPRIKIIDQLPGYFRPIYTRHDDDCRKDSPNTLKKSYSLKALLYLAILSVQWQFYLISICATASNLFYLFICREKFKRK